MMRRLFATVLLLGAEAQAAGASWEGTALEPPALAAGDHFGATLAIGKDLIAVGAYLADIGGKKDAGAVYFYSYDEKRGSWDRLPEILTGENAGDQLGFDLAIDSAGTTLLAGALFARSSGGVRCGAVRKITFDELHNILTDDTLPLPACEEGAEIGSAVAIDGPIIGVGARGAADRGGRIYAKFKSGEDLALLAEGAKGDEIGTSLATDGEWLVAGAPLADAPGAPDSGAVYALKSNQSVRVLPKPERRQARAAFGYSVTLHGKELAVGAPLEDDGPASDAGAVHRFRTVDWAEVQQVARGAAKGDQFGVSVSSSGKSGLFAGARRARSSRGAVYPIVNGDRGAEILSPNKHSKAGDEFGFAVATREKVLVVGAFLEDLDEGRLVDAGAAYVFEQPPEDPTVSFLQENVSVGEAGSVPLRIKIATDGGKPTKFDVQLDFCPPETGCTATKGLDYRLLGRDSKPLGEGAHTVAAGAATPYTLGTVKILPDSLVEGPEILTVRLLPEPPARLEGPELLTITINDSQLVLSPSTLLTREQGPAVPLQVGLASPPTAPVTVIVTTTDPTEGTVTRRRLDFTPQKWIGPLIYLNPVDDPFCDGSQAFAVEVQTRSKDPSYTNLSQSVPAVNEDDEAPFCPLLTDGFESGTFGGWTGGSSP